MAWHSLKYFTVYGSGQNFESFLRRHSATNDENSKDDAMLSWALTFLIIALIAALFGFGGIAGTASAIAQVLFVIFLVAFAVSLFLFGRSTPKL